KIAETFPEGRGSLQARASAAPPGDGIGHGVAFMPGGGCALPGLRSYDLPLIYSPLLLKLPVLTASKSLRRSRKAVAVSRPAQAQRRRAMASGTASLLCRVAAAPYPAYVRTTCR
ncbi:TPA: hypothetical protein ACIFPA_005345, partial [Klebsiella pneumoniae]